MFEEQAGEVSLAYASVVGEGAKGKIIVEVASDVIDDLADHGVRGWWGGYVHAHLRLVARPLQVGHQ